MREGAGEGHEGEPVECDAFSAFAGYQAVRDGGAGVLLDQEDEQDLCARGPAVVTIAGVETEVQAGSEWQEF